ncbi:NHL repeat containing [Chlorella sorokiniana]|uniref:NHL repeat containing n=1 Tax=Chlorella sorokiniana TaxID=3076 RepID=A0A2P6TQB3_CHLSO|nr:NHL repeat containing [Chlorella sorokiniana]|eukprot:PRW56226.1 NHL repeat containing [Chlorella sorokiniana]
MKWRGPHHGRLLALLPLLALSAAVTAQPAGTTAVPQFGTVEGEVYGSVQLFATPEGSTDIPAGCYQIRYAGGYALEPQWQREAVYGSAAECVAMATLNMGQPVVHRHGGGTLGIRSLETRWLDGTTGPGMPGPTWSLEAAACPDQPPASLPALEWRNLSALPSNSDLPRLKAVAANRKGQMWALRDHIWGMRTGETTWGVYFLRNEVWSEYGGAKCSISVLPSGKVFGTFLAQTAWVISTVPFGTIEWNSYVPYYDFPDQPLLDVAAGPDGRLWFVGTTGVYEYAVATSRYIRLPNLLASPLAIAANSQGPTVVTADHRVWRLAAGIWAEIAPGLRACKVAHAPDDGLWIGYFTGTRLAAVRSPPPPPPPPPLDVTIPAGDVCILYSGARKVPKQLLRDITSCACYTTCYGDEACDWRKFCAAGQRRSQCQAAAAQAYDAGNPCPSPPPPPAPATSRDFWATVPAHSWHHLNKCANAQL